MKGAGWAVGYGTALYRVPCTWELGVNVACTASLHILHPYSTLVHVAEPRAPSRRAGHGTSGSTEGEPGDRGEQNGAFRYPSPIVGFGLRVRACRRVALPNRWGCPKCVYVVPDNPF